MGQTGKHRGGEAAGGGGGAGEEQRLPLCMQKQLLLEVTHRVLGSGRQFPINRVTTKTCCGACDGSVKEASCSWCSEQAPLIFPSLCPLLERAGGAQRGSFREQHKLHPQLCAFSYCQGLARARIASDAVGVVLKEVRQHCQLGSFRLLVAVDGVNALWGRTTLKKEDRSPVRSALMILQGEV